MNRAARESWTAYAETHGLLQRPAQARAVTQLEEAPRRDKYGAVKTRVDGIDFDSKKEARVYQELKLRERAGEIAELHRQTAWPLHIMELWRSGAPLRITQVGIYHSDFDYLDLLTGELKVIDVKSEPTRRKINYRLKKKIVEAVHGITVDEV